MMLDQLGRPGRVLLLGGTSEIGLAILAALRAPAGTEVLLAGRDEQRLAAAGKELPFRCTTIGYDALAADSRMRAQRHGTIVVLSSVAAIRPRRANFVYGAAKAGLDAFARGLSDALAGTGVRVVLVRPGFVTGRMTAGMSPAPLASSPAEVGEAVAAALEGTAALVWVPRAVAGAAAVMRLVPRPLWRRMRR